MQSSQINYTQDRLDYANQSGILPAGREIPSMQTHDLYGARPKASTLQRNVWQDQFVPKQIQNQPGYKANQQSLGKKMRSPLFIDYYYKNYDLTKKNERQIQPPEINPQPTNLIKLEQNQFPSQQYNKDLQNYLINESGKVKSSVINSSHQNIEQSIQQYRDGVGSTQKSPYIMHMDPGRTLQKSQPYSYIQSDSIDETKNLLRGDATLSASTLKMYPQTQSIKDFYSPKSNQAINGQRVLNGNANQSNFSNLANQQMIQDKKWRLHNSQSIPNLGSIRDQKNFQPIYNNNNNNTQIENSDSNLQNGYNNNKYEVKQNNEGYGNQQNNQQRVNMNINPNQSAIYDNNNKNNNDHIKNQQQNYDQSYASARIESKKVYKPYNVVTNKIHSSYQPKYDVKVNSWECYDKPQWKDYQAKQKAPVNILREKNRNNIDTNDYTTANLEYGQMKMKYAV
ncbi:hypothetical protein PPERSA_08915 [Pseudocohnilembus persalinus]|uniref:Uncharacterized protein n=1 Tax=Pseudocohnilembus persalinus TaxID=266149 RepID=A0A0V0R2V8_PSEPJ|nr:hypothetical protein PPERSA_08915 [Pseudocohnilembus persalinus]|eukprot:KRX08811.1 hypothetical protein PPERSA_08915 [Pseudocohnilembus persalinus]